MLNADIIELVLFPVRCIGCLCSMSTSVQFMSVRLAKVMPAVACAYHLSCIVFVGQHQNHGEGLICSKWSQVKAGQDVRCQMSARSNIVSNTVTTVT